MAYLDDDFQGYSIGTSLPFGSWTGGGFLSSIVAEAIGTGIPGTDRSLALGLATAIYNRGTGGGAFLTSFTQWFAHRPSFDTSTHAVVTFVNGPNGGGQSFSLLDIRINPDSTLSVFCTDSNQLLAYSYDALESFEQWHFFQVNITLSDVMVSGVNKVNIQCEIALDGVSIISFNTTTSISSSGLANGTAEVNQFQLNNGHYGAYTLDTLQAINTYPHGGAPNAVVFQAVVEIDELPDDSEITVLQAVVEVDELPDSTQLQVFQAVVEVDILVITNRWYISES
jgi:hypothetical protein